VTPTILTALLASGLAVALSREHRIRRTFQNLAVRLLCGSPRLPDCGAVFHTATAGA